MLTNHPIETPIDIIDNQHPFAKFVSGDNLNLSKQNLTDKDVADITRFLLEHPHIRSLDLSLNHIGDQGLADFAERNLAVLHVNFTGNNISDRGLAVFTYINQTVLHANFTYNMISEKGINDFAKQNDICYTAKFSVLQYH